MICYFIFHMYFKLQVEDGNNFGVEIQEETVKMIKDLESDINSLWRDFSGFSGYYKDRAQCVKDFITQELFESIITV